MRVLQNTSEQIHQVKQPVKYLVKSAVTLGLLLLIIRGVNPSAAWSAIALASPLALGAALVLQLLSNSVAALRWFLIMRRLGFRQSFVFYLKSYFKGTFFNQGLPTSIGGDGIRILDCSRGQGAPLDGFYGVFIDRIVGLAGLLLLNIGALLCDSGLLPPRLYYSLLALLTILIAGLVALFFLRLLQLFRRGKWFGLLGALSEKYFHVYASPWDITLQLGLSVFIHLLAMTAFYVLGVSLGLEYPLHVYLILVPPVILLTILPISLAGWGIREGALIGFFLLVGADRSKVLSFSLLYGLVALAGSLPGLWVYLTQKNRL